MAEEEIEEKKPKKETSLSFKNWLTRTVLIGIISIGLVSSMEYFFHIQILTQTLIAIFSILMVWLFHEALHYIRAVRLKYKIKWYRTKFTMGFEIDHPSIRGQITPEKQKIKDDIKKIGRFPYYFLVPVSIIFIVVGYFTWYWGFIVAGIVSLAFHVWTFTQEGISR